MNLRQLGLPIQTVKMGVELFADYIPLESCYIANDVPYIHFFKISSDHAAAAAQRQFPRVVYRKLSAL